MPGDLVARIERHVETADSGCWLWTGKRNRSGYGVMSVQGKTKLAHRISFESHRGPIGAGLQLDHICHDRNACSGGVSCIHRRCVNPDHLEPVSPNENTARGGHPVGAVLRTGRCQRGHEPDWYHRPDGKRGCRPCRERAKKCSDATAAVVAAAFAADPSASIREVATRVGLSSATVHRAKQAMAA